MSFYYKSGGTNFVSPSRNSKMNSRIIGYVQNKKVSQFANANCGTF